MKATSLLFFFILVSCSSRAIDPLSAKDRQFNQCYEESDSIAQSDKLPRNAKVVIEFSVFPDGKIDEEKIVNSPFKDANFHSCLLQITRTLKIPPDNEGRVKKVSKILNFKTPTKMNKS
jgi:hypothetical protein